MKVIDIINDYSNGKELPEKIKVHGTEFIHVCYLCYESQAFDRKQYLFTEDYSWSDWLNEEVEIIEEDKKIEKLELISNGSQNSYALLNEYGTKCGLTKHSKIMCDKINEIIDKINRLENK